MTRIARVVIPSLPHHIVQRGNRRQTVFFNDDDRLAYLDCLKAYAKPAGIHFWAYSLMNNHVYLIAVPDSEESLAFGFAEAHRRYTMKVNFRQGWRGYLWEGRFKSSPLSQAHLCATIRYVENNPVRAGIVKNTWDYPWLSAKAHVFKIEDPLQDKNFLELEIEDWKSFLSQDENSTDIHLFKAHVCSGRPLGDKQFIEEIERLTGRILHKQKPGPKAKR